MDKKEFREKYELLKHKAYVIIYGTNTRLGKLLDLVLLALISISVVTVMLEAVKGVNHRLHGLLVFVEWVIIIFFTMEYILRIISNKRPYRYIFSIYGIIDLIVILPMYPSFIIPSTKAISVARVFRLLRVLRILDLVSFMSQGEELKLALRTSKDKTLVFICFMSVISILLGSLMYVVENERSGFTSIPRGIYWCIIAPTTVGYDDTNPAATLGQIMASLVVMLGYDITTVPTGIITAEYSCISKVNILKEGQRCQQKKLLVDKHIEKVIYHQCNSSSHLEGVDYCSSCGTPLKKQIDRCPEKNDYF